MKKLVLVLILASALLSPVMSFSKSNYDVTSNTYTDTDDWSQACTSEFGSDAQVGDWSDLRSGYNSLGQTEWRNWLDSFYPYNAFLYRNGDKIYSGDRVYFGTKHKGDVPSHYMVHDDINNNWMSLGSWYDNSRSVFCYVPNSPPNNPTGLSPSGGGADVNPQISADFNDPDQDSGTLYFETGGGNDIGSCSVSDGGSCSVTYSSADSWGTGYAFQVYAEDSSGATSGTVSQSFTTNYRPSVSNLQPSGGSKQLNPQLSADVSDNDGDCMDVTFRDSDDGSTVGTDSVCDSGTATTGSSGDDLGSNSGTSYSFDVVVDDSQASVTSGDQSFTTVHNPNNPTNPSPSDGEVDVGLGSALSIGEAGRVSGLGSTSWGSTTFNRGFDEAPYVFATTQTTNGGEDPSAAHIRSVNSGGFETQHCEFENSDDCTSHNSEVNGWFAADPSDVSGMAGWETGLVSVDSGSGNYNINYNMNSEPLLFSQSQTMNGEPALTTRFGSVSNSGADLYFCEQDGADSCDSSHANEEVAWLALDPSQVSERDGFEYGTFTTSDDSWESISFDQSFDVPPVVIADVQTTDGQDALYPEVDNVDINGADVRFCESDAGNDCDSHGSREVAWMAVEPAALGVDVSHPDGQSMDVTFRINDGSGYSTVGTDSSVSDGGTATVTPSLELSNNYDWYVDIDTSGYSTSTQSSTWSFQTEHNVDLDSISGPDNDPAALNPTLDATVSHSDPNEELTVDFVNDDNGNVICSQPGVTDTETVTCDTSGEAFGSDTGTNYNWRVELSGDQASESFTSSSQSFTTVSAPSVTLTSPNDGAEDVGIGADLVAGVSQAEGLQLNTVITLEDDQGSFVDDYSVNSGNGEVRFSDPGLSLSGDYEWYADTSIVDSAYSQSDSSSTRSFSTEHNISADILNPSDGESVVGVESTLQAEVQHSDSSRESTVTFYDGNDNVLGTDSGLADGDVAEFDTSGSSFGGQTGTNYEWYVQVDDGERDSDVHTSETVSFTTIHEPNPPFNGAPTGPETTLGTGLDVEAAHQDGEQMQIDFYLNNTLEDTVLSGPGDVSLQPEALTLEEGTEYNWYAEASVTDEHNVVHSATSDTWSFETVHRPEVVNVSPADGEKNVFINTDLDFEAVQEDNRSLDVQVFSSNGTELHSGTGVSPEDVKVTTDDHWFASEPNRAYEWYAVVEEPQEGLVFDNSANPWNFTTIGTPDEPVDPEPADGEPEADVNTTLSVYVDHEDVESIDVLFFNEETGNELGRNEDVEAGSRAELEIDEDFQSDLTSQDQEFGSEFDEEYEWYTVAVADGATMESEVFNYSTVRPGNVIEDVRAGDGNLNPGSGDNGGEFMEVQLTHDQGEVIDEAIFTDSAGDTVYVGENITSGGEASFNVSEHWPSGIEEDEQYEWNLEVRNKGYSIGDFTGEFTTYTDYLSWDPPASGNQDHYVVYHSAEDTEFDHGNNDYENVGRPHSEEFVDSNPELQTGENCYRVVSVNIAGESDPVPLDQGECINVN